MAGKQIILTMGNNFLNDGKQEEDAGRSAARAGLPITDCPYPKGSIASYDWIVGWHSGNEITWTTTADGSQSANHFINR